VFSLSVYLLFGVLLLEFNRIGDIFNPAYHNHIDRD